MLPNAYFLAKFRFDTAENEPAKICKICIKNNQKLQNLSVLPVSQLAGSGGAGSGIAAVLAMPAVV